MSRKIMSAMNIARRMAGGRVGYAEGGAPDDARMKRRIANQSLAGRDLTYEQMQYLADAMPEKEARSQALGEFGAELTGIPSIARGGSNVARGIEEGDPIRGAGGVLEAGIGMVPYAGMLGRIPAAVASQAFKTVPRTAAVLGTSAALNAYPDEAQAAQRNAATFISEDSEVKALQAEKQKAMEAFGKINQQHARSGPETQRQALKPYEAELKRINDKLEKAEDRARQQFMDQASFRDKYPGVPGAMFGAGLGLAGGIPLLKGLMERGADRMTRKPAIDNAMRTARDALDGTATNAQAAAAQTILRNKLAAWDESHSGVGTAGKYLGAFGTGAMLGAEASQLPEQIDYITNEPGHPARELAVKQFQNPDYWKERIGPAAIGAGVGLLGAKVPNIPPRNLEFLTEAREVASRGQAPSAMQQLMARFRGKEPAGPTEAAIADVKRYREAAGMPVQPPTSKSTSSAQPSGPTPPGPSVAAEPIAPRVTFAGPPEGMVPAHAIEDAMPAFGPSSVQGPSPTSAAPASSPKTFPNSDVPLPPGVDINARGVAYNVHTGHPLKKQLYTAKDAGKSKSASKAKTPKDESVHADDVPVKPDKLPDDPSLLTRGMNRGGVVASALRIARAMGGRVHTGPILQRADGGRTDTVPMDVAAGSYVIPADIVSALGEGDTGAGMKAIDGMFGPHAEGGAKDAVPIIAAGGEYVLSPTQVAAIANGDMGKAHAMLDEWVKATRAKHIETLANLPGPER